MVSNPYSTLLKTSHSGAGGVYTVPAGKRTVLRYVTGFNANALSHQPVQIVHGPSGCTVYQRSLDVQQWAGDDTHFVCNAGDTLTLVNGPDCDLTLSGYELLAP